MEWWILKGYRLKIVLKKKHIDIIGAGPSGLFAAYLLLEKGHRVDLYDHSSGVGKKFLVAGNGGLNLTHSDSLEYFSKKYTKHQDLFGQLLVDFSPSDLRDFCAKLGVETFVGTSGRVFPKELNAATMLRNWMNLLKSYDQFNIHLNHQLTDIKPFDSGTVIHMTDLKSNICKEIQCNYLMLGLGGGSWKKTGSDGRWSSIVRKLGIKVSDFYAYNCGYEITWGDKFKNKVEYSYLKNVAINNDVGEVMITPYGIEGSLIYANSKKIQDEISAKGFSKISIDLRPKHSIDSLLIKLGSARIKDSRKNQLRKCLKIKDTEYMLLMEILSKEEIKNNQVVAQVIKRLELHLEVARPIDEAISTGGGVDLSEVSEDFESKKIKGLYFLGEMLNWDAPTGGYLLQGCFSIANRACGKF